MILCRIQIGIQWMLEKKWWKEIVETEYEEKAATNGPRRGSLTFCSEMAPIQVYMPIRIIESKLQC